MFETQRVEYWGLFMMNVKELMLSAVELKHLFCAFIEPSSDVFTRVALRELTSKEEGSEHFLGCLKVLAFKQVALLTKQYLGTLNVTLLEIAEKSTN